MRMNSSVKRSIVESFKIGWKAFLLGTLMSILAAFVALRFREADTVLTLETMKLHMKQISPGLSSFCRNWAKENGHPTWLCGPTSYALADALNRKYFESKLPIVLDRLPGPDCIQIVLGVALVPTGSGDYRVMDHVWIQIYWRNLIIMVDPTFSQFDNLDRVVFAWFDDNDSGQEELRIFLNLLRLQELSSPLPGGFDNSDMYRAYLKDSEVLKVMFQNNSLPKDWYRWNRMVRKVVE